MTQGELVWRGTEQESRDLIEAIKPNCACTYAPITGARVTTCPSHAMLLEQAALDHLLFARRIRACLERGEFESVPLEEDDG